jgi:hypothetical protein
MTSVSMLRDWCGGIGLLLWVAWDWVVERWGR